MAMQLTPKKQVLGVAGLTVLALTLAIVFVRSQGAGDSDPDAGDGLSLDDLSPERQPVAVAQAPAADPPNSLDLLDLVRVQRDAVAGTWGFQGRSLFTPRIRWGRLQLPVIPPEEYDLKLQVTRRRGSDALDLGFVYKGRQGMLHLDGWGGELSWVDLTTTYEMDDNLTRKPGRMLPWRKPCTVLLSVRKAGIEVSINGKKSLEWSGEASDLGLQPAYRIPNPKALQIAAWEAVFEISELTLTPVTGTATLLQ